MDVGPVVVARPRTCPRTPFPVSSSRPPPGIHFGLGNEVLLLSELEAKVLAHLIPDDLHNLRCDVVDLMIREGDRHHGADGHVPTVPHNPPRIVPELEGDSIRKFSSFHQP
ncbi:MAG: hypothetical protein H6Q51_470 [Deltaproteobacteria bacterium]|nr:hypothetical protein [Deltaproteobacteria bacterium]